MYELSFNTVLNEHNPDNLIDDGFDIYAVLSQMPSSQSNIDVTTSPILGGISVPTQSNSKQNAAVQSATVAVGSYGVTMTVTNWLLFAICVLLLFILLFKD